MVKFICLYFVTAAVPLSAVEIGLIHNFTQNPEELLKIPHFNKVKEELEAAGHHLTCVNDSNIETFDKIFIWNYPSKGLLKKLPKEKLIFFTWEPPVVMINNFSPTLPDQFEKIYTWDDSLVDEKKYFKFHYPVLSPIRSPLPPFERRKLCTFIFSNKKSDHPKELYTERKKILRYFEKQGKGDFEFYGNGWKKKKYEQYMGTVEDKIETLSHYRFAICYENTRDIQGYVTEKIFDCFAAGSIPVYMGATNIESYVPKNCFINRYDFRSDGDLHHFLKSVTKEQYENYLSNIKAYLESKEAQKFSLDQFILTLKEAVK